VLTTESPKNIIMVDDDAEDIFLTRTLLKRAGMPAAVTGLNSGEELYNYIKNNGVGSIDVILLDINMPIEDGFDVLKKLTQYPDIAELKIIMYSTSKRPHETSLALKLGANGFVEKPRRIEDVENLSTVIFEGEHHNTELSEFG